jgi:hypothetical protein
MDMSPDRIKTIEDRLRQIDAERKALADELISIRSQSISQARPFLGLPVHDMPPETPDEKVELFISLFRCRETVYPKLWLNQKQNKN